MISVPGTRQAATFATDPDDALIDRENQSRFEDQSKEDISGDDFASNRTVARQVDTRGQQADNPLGPEVVLMSGDTEEGNIEQQFAEIPTERFQKGPVSVPANLDPETEKSPLISSPDQPARETIIEAEPIDHLALEEKAYSLPEIVHIPFEDAVKDEVLQGWEDHWVAHGSYEVKKWGKLAEPKIDFVYLCEYTFIVAALGTPNDRVRG